MTRKTYCRGHRQEPAGWRCEVCHSQLCPDCAVQKRVCGTELVTCGFCGALAKRIRIHRSSVSYARRLARELLYPINRWGIPAMFMAVVLLTLLGYFKTIGVVVASAFLWACTFWLIRKSGRGTSVLESLDLSGLISDLFLPSLRGLVATAWLWVPAAIYVISRRGPAREPVALTLDPVIWILLGVAILYLPMALLVAAAGSELREMMNPFAVISRVSRLGRDYLVAGSAIVFLTLGYGLAVGIGISLNAVRIPFLPKLFAGMLCIYFPIVMARVLGLLLYVRGDALYFGFSEDYYCDALPGEEARGTEKVKNPVKRVRPTAIELDAPERVEKPVKHVRPTVIELDPPEKVDELAQPIGLPTIELDAPEPEEAKELPPPEQLAQALAQEQYEVAVRMYEGAAESVLRTFRGADHFAIGHYATVHKNYPLAVRALTRVACSSEPVAPRAMVILARVYEERLGNGVTAQRIYRAVLAKHPNTKAASFAADRLAHSGPAGLDAGASPVMASTMEFPSKQIARPTSRA